MRNAGGEGRLGSMAVGVVSGESLAGNREASLGRLVARDDTCWRTAGVPDRYRLHVILPVIKVGR